MGDYIITGDKFERTINNMPKEYYFPWYFVEAEVYKYPIQKGNFNNNINTGNEVLNAIISNPESIGFQKYDKKKRKYSC